MALMDGKIDKKHVDMINSFKNECITFAKIVDFLKSNHKKGQTMIERKIQAGI